MLCPNCSTKLATLNYDNQEVLHCPKCSGSFFELNGINRISLQSARVLSLEQIEGETIKPNVTKLCPKDQTPLYVITHNSAVPQNVSLYECSTCKGVFAMPDDLYNFKKAQNVKIDFFKIWNTPMPSLKTVLVLSSFVFIFASILSTVIPRQQTTSTRASEVVKSVFITGTGQQLFIYFSTPQPATARIVLRDMITGEILIKKVSEKPVSAHSVTIDQLDLTHEYSYHIIVTDGNGNEIQTNEKIVEIK